MKLVLPVLILLLGVGIYFATRPAAKISGLGNPANHRPALQNTNAPLLREPALATNRLEGAQPVSGTSSNVRSEGIEQQMEALTDASTKSDSDSFQLIVNALKNQRPEIRAAAREAAIQFGSIDAIPFLKEAATKTDDPREKVEILDAIEFLELPSFGEVKALRRTNVAPVRR